MSNPELKFIGKIVSSKKDSSNMPLQGANAQVVIFDEYADALDGLDKYSHVWIVSWLHKADRDRLKVVPKRVDADSPPRGVFSLRSPVRPNPLGLTASKLIKREGNILHLDHVDFLDGTPVVDVKPYSVGWDSIFSAWNNSTYETYVKMPIADVFADMLRQAANFHGDACVGVAIGTRAANLAMRHFKCDMQTKSLTVSASVRGCTADAIQGLLQAGNKRFIRVDPYEGKVVFTKDGGTLTLVITTDKFHSVEEVMNAPDDKVFSSIEEG